MRTTGRVAEGSRGSDTGHHLSECPSRLRSAAADHVRGLDDVPLLAALEAAIIDSTNDVQRVLFREKENVLVAGTEDAASLVRQLAERWRGQDDVADLVHIDMFTQLPDVIARVEKVRPLILAGEVPEGPERRYREAVRSYTHGNPIACCVLCRAVIERALIDAWTMWFSDRARLEEMALKDRISIWERRRVLPPEALALLQAIKRAGDRAVHDAVLVKPEEALKVLHDTQAALQTLFKAKPAQRTGSAPAPFEETTAKVRRFRRSD